MNADFVTILSVVIGLLLALVLLNFLITLFSGIMSYVYGIWSTGHNTRRYNEDKKRIIKEKIVDTRELDHDLSIQDIERIVDVESPKGYWSNRIFAQRLKLLMAMQEVVKEEREAGNKLSYWRVWSLAADKMASNSRGTGLRK